MIKRFLKRVTVNFRQTRSERVATQSYRDYHNKMRRLINKANIFKKLNK